MNGLVSSQELRIGGKVLNNTKDEFLLRGDVLKDDSGNYAAFTEEGAAASHMTAAKSLGRYFKILDKREMP